jgi:hypothetical protein
LRYARPAVGTCGTTDLARGFGESGLGITNCQAIDERGDHQRDRAVVLVTWAPSSRNANASVVPRSFSLGQVRGPAVVFGVTSRCPSRDPGRASSQDAARWYW